RVLRCRSGPAPPGDRDPAPGRGGGPSAVARHEDRGSVSTAGWDRPSQMGLVSVRRSAVDVRKGGLRDRGDPRQIRYRSQRVMSSGRVISLHIRGVKHAAPTLVGEAVGRVGGGIEGDVHAERTSRAVLVVDRATLDALRLSPGDLREEITIEGLPDVTNLPIDTELRIGGVTLRVNGPCQP